MKKEILYVEQLTTDQSSSQNIDHVTFSLEQGKILGITGLHNSGIMALAGALSGEIPICHGTVYLEDAPVKLTSRTQANQLGIFHITQELAVIPTLTVSENMNILRMQNRQNLILHPRTDLETTRSVFEHYRIGGNPDGYPPALSVGQRTQLSICRAVICGARVLICSAPGEGTSEADLLSLRRFLQMLRDEGLSILIITPDARTALFLSDQVAVMRSGMICYRREVQEASLEDMVCCMAAMKAAAPLLRQSPEREDYRIGLRNLIIPGTKTRSHPINLDLAGGTSLGLLWPAQSYGSDVRKAFLGQSSASGTVLQNGCKEPFRKWRKRNRHQIACLGLRFWEQDLQENMTVAENLLLRTYHRYDRRLGILNPVMLNLALREFSEAYGLDPDCLNRYPRHLSPELRHQVVLWSVLFAPPRLLVLDCPMFTMDEQIRRNYLSALEDLKRGGTAILWSDNGEFPKYYCDRYLSL